MKAKVTQRMKVWRPRLAAERRLIGNEVKHRILRSAFKGVWHYAISMLYSEP